MPSPNVRISPNRILSDGPGVSEMSESPLGLGHSDRTRTSVSVVFPSRDFRTLAVTA
jgi:hypothetical protein